MRQFSIVLIYIEFDKKLIASGEINFIQQVAKLFAEHLKYFFLECSPSSDKFLVKAKLIQENIINKNLHKYSK